MSRICGAAHLDPRVTCTRYEHPEGSLHRGWLGLVPVRWYDDPLRNARSLAAYVDEERAE